MSQDARPNVRLHIERLILDGLPVKPAQASAIREAVEVELTRLLTESSLGANWQTGGAVHSVQADAIQVTRGSGPAQIGTQIAQAVHSGIGEPR